MPAFDAHFNVLTKGYKIMKNNNEDASIVIVNFGLCPTSPYPTQLRQMILATQHLTKSRPANNIALAGDSAGANLMLALLLHLNGHAHPKVPPYNLPAGQKFREAFLISPGTPTITSTASMTQTPIKDILTPEIGRQLFDVIVSTAEVELPNPWFASQDVPEDWWRGVPVGRVIILIGDFELLRDDVLSWSTTLKKCHEGEVITKLYPDEVHDQLLMDNMMGIKEDKASTKDFKSWFQEFKA